MSFGERLRNARKKMDITQKEIADHISMNQSNYSKLERDLQQPNILQIQKICNLLEISADVLLDTQYSYSTDRRLITELQDLIRKYGESIFDEF